VVFVAAWVLLPALLTALSLGCGLLVERLSTVRLPGVLLVPLGLAAIVVLARAAMTLDLTAELGTPLVVAAAIAGYVLGRDRLRRAALDRWAVGAALAVFGVYAAPVVLSGSATFLGYTVLGDTAVHFTLIDRIATHGTSLTDLPPSSYRVTLEAYFASGYPLGAHATLAAVRPLAFIDVAWAFQPFLAFIAAALALSLAGLVQGVVRTGWRSAAIAAIAAQPTLAYAFAAQGSVKELATLWVVPLLAALVGALAALPDSESAPNSFRYRAPQLLPLAIASAAGIGIIGVAVAPWLGPVLLVALWVVIRRQPRSTGRIAALTAAFAGAVVLLSLPTLVDLGDYLDVTKEVVTTSTELGNLLAPLDGLQVFGIWLNGDYRLPPTSSPGLDDLTRTHVLIGLAAASGVLGIAWLVRRRAIGPLLYIAASLIALWYVTRTGSPWADGKALAIASPAVLLAAALGPVALEGRGPRVVAAVVVAALLAGGVLVSNALIYHEVSLAPRERLAELSDLGERTAGRGPLLYTEFEEFTKHFLRDTDPVGATEGLEVPGLMPRVTDGGRPAFATAANVSTLLPEDVNRFTLLVQRRGPDGQRPPAGWRRTWVGRYYELWRQGSGPEVVAHQAAPETRCAGLRRLARRARAVDGRLASASTPRIVQLLPAKQELPFGWGALPDGSGLVQTIGAGIVSGSLWVPRSGEYEVWLAGSFARSVEVRIDGRLAGWARDELSQPASWIELDRLWLNAGRRRVELLRGGGTLAPGNGDGRRMLGPLALRPAGEAPRVSALPAQRWRSLCGRTLAWAEVIRRGA
jgi:hypothetical protein